MSSKHMLGSMSLMDEEFIVTVGLPAPHSPVTINCKKSWTVAEMKREVGKKCPRVDPNDIRILFQGRAMDESERFQDIDLGNHSFLYVVRGSQHVKQIRFNIDATAEPSPSAAQTTYTSYFYVYCKSPCKKVTSGKLRVRCYDCKKGTLELSPGQEPGCWADVLTRKRLRGQCGNTGCRGTYAEFCFKCGVHWAGENDASSPLSMVQPNFNDAACIICTDKAKVILVFGCVERHAICEGCFTTYCTMKLDSHEFNITKEYGYTVGCPNRCENSFVPDAHHFHILGDEQYDRYQKMSAISWVREEGGVICPVPQCSSPCFPRSSKVTCDGCKYTFCKQCMLEYHPGSCQSYQEALEESIRIDARRAEQAATAQLVRELTKPCPCCSAPTEKDDGCNHMTCTARDAGGELCGFDWCWVCVKEWNRECRSAHWFAPK